jgi:hypothetical protein
MEPYFVNFIEFDIKFINIYFNLLEQVFNVTSSLNKILYFFIWYDMSIFLLLSFNFISYIISSNNVYKLNYEGFMLN